jgi:hypothetical protein
LQPPAFPPRCITIILPFFLQNFSDFLVATKYSALFLHPLPLSLFFGFLDYDLIVFTSIEVALRAISAASSAVWSEMFTKVSIALAISNVLAADVTHLVATYTCKLVAAR